MDNVLGYGRITASAGTAIAFLVGGYSSPNGLQRRTAITGFSITSGSTAHTWGFLRSGSRSTVTTAVAAAGTSVVVDSVLLDGDGNALAANDYIAVKLDNGNWHLSTVSAWNATTKTITLNTAVPTGRSIGKGAAVVVFGVIGDTVHALHKIIPPTSATTNYGQNNETMLFSGTSGEPILVYNANATNASVLENLQINYV